MRGKPRTPRTQGLVEQANGVVKDKITKWLDSTGSTTWHEGLTDIIRAMNTQGTRGLPIGANAYMVFFERQKRNLSPAQRVVDINDSCVQAIQELNEEELEHLSEDQLISELTAPALYLLPVDEASEDMPEPDVIEIQKERQQSDDLVLQHQAGVRRRMIASYRRQHRV